MNFVTSLLIYNPLEALCILAFVAICKGDKIGCKTLFCSFILGAANLFLQYGSKLFTNPKLIFISDIFIALFLMTMTTKLAYVYIYRKVPSNGICFLSCAVNFISVYVSANIFSLTGIADIIYIDRYPDLVQELVCNMGIRCVHFLILLCVNLGGKLYAKNHSKEDCD
jgi:hypothetical protein